jgi:hypothetical protein
MAEAAISAYPVKLVAVSGREQPVVLKVKRDGLWLFTEHGKVRGGASAGPLGQYSSTASAAVCKHIREATMFCSQGIIASSHPCWMPSSTHAPTVFLDRPCRRFNSCPTSTLSSGCLARCGQETQGQTIAWTSRLRQHLARRTYA